MVMGSFEMQVKDFTGKAETAMERAGQRVAMEAFKKIIYRTPVKTGVLRGGWGCEIGNPYAGLTGAIDKDGGPTVAKAKAIIDGWDATKPIYLMNNLSYAIPIEYGGSPVKSPAGMVRVTVAEMGGVAESIARKV
jgi:hypothetical protein